MIFEISKFFFYLESESRITFKSSLGVSEIGWSNISEGTKNKSKVEFKDINYGA